MCPILPVVIYLNVCITENKIRSETACCSHQHTWELAQCRHTVVLFTAALSRGERCLYMLCTRAPSDGLMERCLILLSPHLLLPSSLWSDHTPTQGHRVGNDLLPFPPTAMTHMRLLYHCQRQRQLSAADGPWASASVLAPRGAHRISGPTHCCISPGRVFVQKERERRWGVGGEKKEKKEFPPAVESISDKLVGKEWALCANVHLLSMWALIREWQITASKAAPGFRVCPSWPAPIWDG